MFSVSSEETERFRYLPRVTQLLNSYWGQAGCKNSIVSESDVNSGTSWTKEVASCSVPRVCVCVGALQAPENVEAEGEKEDRVDPALSRGRRRQNKIEVVAVAGKPQGTRDWIIPQRPTVAEEVCLGGDPGLRLWWEIQPWTQVSSSQSLPEISPESYPALRPAARI